ncbi:hypothetical protein L873DRAFT_1730438 [Choiromyces venosus 120613-1]|uniref:C2H2-type domain-containing protein n=1 Tax=Choiromyces venosus 120613-1 TaxID=1336337 RepID=A0A3N4K3S7_9PEZI|nr:hypothetical protein L873DRAFT_1730438 [Choiromyces venosus 120613-1]
MPGRVKLTSTAPVEAISSTKSPATKNPISTAKGLRKRLASSPPPSSGPNSKSAKTTAETAGIELGELAPPPELAPKRVPVKNTAGKPREKKFPCTESGCDKRFTRPCRLTEHLRSHTGERPFQCSVEGCTMSFLRESHLKAHTRAKHLQDKRYVCTFVIPEGEEDQRGNFGFKRVAGEGGKVVDGGRECGAKFTTNQHLKRHLESHQKAFPHVCVDYPPCNEGFRKRGPLARHVREVHLGLLPWACPHKDTDDSTKHCSFASDAKRKLESHITSQHSGLPKLRFWCDICRKNPNPPPLEDISTDDTAFPIQRTVLPDTTSFTSYRELRAHTNAAHPPICPHCSHRSPSRKALMLHIHNKHDIPLDKRRTHICEICGQGLTKPQYVKTHIKIVHKGYRPFVCPHCPRDYQYKAPLQKHIARAHNPNPVVNVGEREPRRSRTLIRRLGLIEELSGYGYENSGRHIACVVDGCRWRYARLYDLKNHLGGANGHGLSPEQVDELMNELENDGLDDDEMCDDEMCDDDENASEWDNENIENEEDGWSDIESGSESDEDWGFSDEDDEY